MRKSLLAAIFFLLIPSFCFAEIRYEDVLELSKKAEPRAHADIERDGAQIEPTKDGRSFLVWWEPQGFDPKKDIVLVSLHGHENWAAKNFTIWHSRMQEHGWATASVQWWYGRSGGSAGYAKPRDIYPWIREALKRHDIPPGHVIFEGYSMGSANSYAVTFLDRQSPKPYFAATISNSGAMEEDFPPNRPFLKGEAGGLLPFEGAHWFLYCSENDKERPGACEQMAWTEETLTKLGAKVELFIRDTVGPHGGFMQNGNADRVLEEVERLVKTG